nr:MAG TPA: hypothetical protein [Caudoviricetes sp.]
MTNRHTKSPPASLLRIQFLSSSSCGITNTKSPADARLLVIHQGVIDREQRVRLSLSRLWWDTGRYCNCRGIAD